MDAVLVSDAVRAIEPHRRRQLFDRPSRLLLLGRDPAPALGRFALGSGPLEGC